MNRRSRSKVRSKRFAVGYLPITISQTAYEFRNSLEYQDLVSDFLATKEAQFTQEVEAQADAHKLSGEGRDAFYDSVSEDYEKWRSSFPNAVRSSVLLLACMQLEAGLARLCQQLERYTRVSTQVLWGDLSKDSGIKRAAKFLKENFGIHCEDNQQWSKILSYYLLRNCVAHASGTLDDLTPSHQRKTRAAIHQLASLGVHEDSLSSIVLSREFVKRVIRDMSDFWDALSKALEDNQEVGPVYWP